MNSFTRLDAKHIAEIQKLVSEVLTGSDIHEDYFHDELAGAPHPPEAVVRPRSTAEVSALMKYAYANNIPVLDSVSFSRIMSAESVFLADS